MTRFPYRKSIRDRLLRRLLAVAWAATAAGSPTLGQAPVTPGFPNVAQTPGAILSGLNAPGQGRTAIIAYHNGVLFTVPELPASEPGSDFQVRTWDISDPTAPVELAQWGVSPMPINAHGYFKSGSYLILGPNWPPDAPWSFLATGPQAVARTELPQLQGVGVRGDLFQPWFVGETYWSYDEVSGNAVIARDGVELASWDHLGTTGVIGHPFLLGDLLIFASDQSRTGVATYDVSDPTDPVLLDVLTTGGPGGYWPELWGGDGHLYVVFPYRMGGNGFRVVDATDPTDLRFVTDRPLPGAEAMYIQFQDEYAFLGDHKVDMRTFESVLFLDGAHTVRPSDGQVGIDTSQFQLPLGNLLVTGGVGPNQGMAIWAHQADPDTRGPSVGYHVPQAGRLGYPTGAPISVLIHETLETATIVPGVTFIVRPLGGSQVAGRWVFSFDDVLTFTPDAPLLADTTYEVVFPAGGIKDAAGNGMVAYSFTFSTGASVGGNGPPAISAFTAASYPVSPGQSQTLQAVATDPDLDAVELRFDFGDGSPATAWSAATSANHTYAAEGHYLAVVQARDDQGAIATRTLTVTVVDPPAGPRPTNSSPIVCDTAARRVWTVNPDTDTVAAIDADSLAKDLEVAACDDPRSLARSASGEIWVTCHDDDRIAVLSAASGATITHLDTGYGSAPAGIALSPNGTVAYVALEGRGELRRFNTATRQPTGSVPLGPTPRAVAVSGDGGRVLVTRFISPRQHGEVWDVAAAGLTLQDTIRIPKFGDGLNADTTAAGRGVANYLAGVTVSPDGQRAWVPSSKANTERGVFFAEDLDQDNTVRDIVSFLDLGAATLNGAIDLDNSDSAVAVAYSPLGDYLLVALQGNNELVVLDALGIDDASGLGSLVTRLGTGLAPQGICVDPATNRVFVQSFMDRGVTVLEADGLFRTGSISVGSTEVSTVAAETLAPDVLLGKQIFYNAGDRRMSSEGYLSCATCHADGGHDGRVWDFTGRGEGFRNTTSLRGRAGTGHGNVHWTANFDEIQDFENDIRNAFGGLGLMDDTDFAATSATLGAPKAGLSTDLDALAAYVASLSLETLPRSPYRTAVGAMTAQAQAGRAVFESLGCAACHAGASLTDSTLGTATLHDVGTLRTSSGQRLGGPLTGIDTPTLLGLWSTAPYLHDGSAATLADVFRLAGGTVVQAEDGSPTGGATPVTEYVDLNFDNTVHGQSLVSFDASGARLTLTGVDGGSGGVGALEIRYSAGYAVMQLDVRVNGASRIVNLPPTANDPQWRHTYWEAVRVDDVVLAAGPSNTLELTAVNDFPNLSVDDVLVTTADDLAAAQPHRQVLALPSADRDALVAFLLQLDGSPNGLGSAIFQDGFESGNTSAWSSTVP